MDLTPRILADNLFSRSGVSVTDPGAASGYPAANLYDGIGWLKWMPDTTADKELIVDAGSAVAPDAWGLVGHNLFTETTTAALYYSDASATGPWTLEDSYAPTSDEDFMRALDGTESHRYWRILFSSIDATSLFVSEALLGEAVSFSIGLDWRGFDPDDEEPVTSMQRNRLGHVIGVQFDHSRRRQRWIWPMIPTSELDDATTYTGFGWWRKEIARRNVPALYLWNADETSQTYQHEAIWGHVTQFPRQPLRTALADGWRRLELEITGRVSGEDD